MKSAASSGKKNRRVPPKLSTLAAEEQTTTARSRQTDSPRLIHLVRGDLDWIVMKCLEKDRTRRYETANGLASDIERHINNEPVVARPPSQLYRFQKLVRRNKLAFAAASSVALRCCSARWRAHGRHNARCKLNVSPPPRSKTRPPCEKKRKSPRIQPWPKLGAQKRRQMR